MAGSKIAGARLLCQFCFLHGMCRGADNRKLPFLLLRQLQQLLQRQVDGLRTQARRCPDIRILNDYIYV